jgi:hypothetical protein
MGRGGWWVDVSIRTVWAKGETGRQFKGFSVEIIFSNGAVGPIDAKNLYIDDKEVESDFDYLYVEARMVKVDDRAKIVRIYR